MSEQTKIQYADHTFNPWIGCSKVSAGCANCCAERSMPAKMFGVKWGQPETYHLSKSWDAPLRWNADAGKRLVLVQPNVMVSLCDWLDPEVPIERLAKFLDLTYRTPNLVWLLLTKRIEWFHGRLHAVCEDGAMKEFAEVIDFVSRWKSGQKVPQNVALGVSVEDQQTADERIPQLLRIPAWRRWVSAEPLLGLIDLECLNDGSWHDKEGANKYNALKGYAYWWEHGEYAHGLGGGPRIDWAVVGGESGPKARPCNVEWVRSIVQQCKSASVPCFVKQLGGNARDDDRTGIDSKDGDISRIPLRHPKGGDPAEWPEELRVREEMP